MNRRRVSRAGASTAISSIRGIELGDLVCDLGFGGLHRLFLGFLRCPSRSDRGRKKGGPQAHLSQRIRMRTKVNAEYSHRDSPIKRDFRRAAGLRAAQTSTIRVTGPSLTSSTSIVGPEHAALGPEQLADQLVERLGDLRRRRAGEARPVALADVAVERELADAEDPALAQRLRHPALGVVEDPQRPRPCGRSAAPPPRRRRARRPSRTSMPGPDRADRLAVDARPTPTLTRWTSARTSRSGGAQALPVDPVVLAVGPQVGGDREVPAGVLGAAAQVERPAEAEVREVVGRVPLDDGLELGRGLARSGASGTAPARAPRGPTTSRAPARRPCPAAPSRRRSRRSRAARSRGCRACRCPRSRA